MFFFWGIDLLTGTRNKSSCPDACRVLGVVTLVWAGFFIKDCVLYLAGDPFVFGGIPSALDLMAVPAALMYLFAICRPDMVFSRFLKVGIPYFAGWGLFFAGMLLFPSYRMQIFYVLFLFTAVYVVALFIFIHRSLVSYHRYLRENYSFEKQINLRWVAYVTVLLIFNTLLFFLSYASEWLNLGYYLILSGLWWVLQNYARSQEFAEGTKEEFEAGTGVLPEYVENRKEKLEEVGRKLEKVMGEKAFYLDPELSLAKLAGEIGTNKTYLYQYLKYYKEISFLDYINALRIEKKAIPMLEGSPVSTIGEISCASGFQSVSTFRRAFVKMQGCSPSTYREKAKENQLKMQIDENQRIAPPPPNVVLPDAGNETRASLKADLLSGLFSGKGGEGKREKCNFAEGKAFVADSRGKPRTASKPFPAGCQGKARGGQGFVPDDMKK